MPTFIDPILSNRPATPQKLAVTAVEKLQLGQRVVVLTDEDYTLQPQDGLVVCVKGSGSDQTISLPADAEAAGFAPDYKCDIFMPDAPGANGFVTSGLADAELDLDAAGASATVRWMPSLGSAGEWHDVSPSILLSGSIGTAELEDEAVTEAKIADSAVTPSKQSSDSRSLSDTNAVIAADDRILLLTTTSGGSGNTISDGTMIPGVPYMAVMVAHDTNNYTAALAGSLTLTLDAVGEGAYLITDGSDLFAIPFGGAAVA